MTVLTVNTNHQPHLPSCLHLQKVKTKDGNYTILLIVWFIYDMPRVGLVEKCVYIREGESESTLIHI